MKITSFKALSVCVTTSFVQVSMASNAVDEYAFRIKDEHASVTFGELPERTTLMAKEGDSVRERERVAAAQSAASSVSSDSDRRPTESGRSRAMEEVIVTAQKRDERLQDVPISISVVSGEQLDASTLTNLTDTMNRVPGVVAVVPSGGNPSIVIRGAPPTGGLGTVGYYMDSIPFGFARGSQSPDANVYDFERIEVLRGPQGTLYGANAVTGVVRLLTKSPDLNRFEAKTRVSAAAVRDGSENYRADAALNVPLMDDRLAMRLVAGYQDLSGWIDKPNDADANRGDIKTLRAKLRAQPTEALTLDAVAWFSRSSFGAQSIGQEDRTTPVTVDEPISSDFDAYSLSAAYDFGSLSLTSATSYIDFAIDNTLSFQAINLPDIVMTSGLFPKVFAQEVTLQSAQEGRWRWSVGSMYRDAKDHNTQAFNGVASRDDGDRSKSYALFGETTRELMDGRLEATIGLRYFHDKFSTAQNINAAGDPLISAEYTSDAVTPRAVLAWHPTQAATVYASYAQGFRSGVTQSPATIGNPLFAASGLGSVKPDKLSNYEVGGKGTVFDGRLSIESAVYYMDWQDVKASVGVSIAGTSGPFVTALVNGPGASGPGADLGISFRPVDSFEIGGSVSWNDLTMDDEVRSSGFLLYQKGDRLAYSSETTAGGYLDYSVPLGGLTGHFNASVSYISSQTQVYEGPAVYEGDDITSVSARITIDSDDGWSVSLFGDNLGDENGIASNNAGFDVWQPRLWPRTVGIQLEYQMRAGR